MRIISNILFIFLFLTSLSSEVKEDVIAKINGEAILRSDYENARIAITQQYSEISPDIVNNSTEIAKMALDKIESETLIKQEAAKLNIKVSEREMDNGVAEVKARFMVDSKGGKLSKEQAEKIFVEELKKQNMSYEEFRSKIKKDLMARKLIEQVIKPKVLPPEEQEIKKFYDNLMLVINNSTYSIKASKEEMEDYLNIAAKLKEMFSERVRIRHILIKPSAADISSKNEALNKAKSIRERLIKGEDFEELALKESNDAESAKRGGDVGYVIKGMLPEEMEKVAFAICPGEISEVIETPFGYHIIEVTEKKIEQKIKYDLVKDDIANIMMQQKFSIELQKYVEELKKKSRIEIFDSNLK